MITINLIYPEQSDIPFNALVFPDGQPHIKMDTKAAQVIPAATPLRILARLASPADLLGPGRWS